MRIILASGSPRRRELLREVFPEFDVIPPDVEETWEAGESPRAVAERLALAKARQVSKLAPGALVIGSDTVVAHETDQGWRILGKPADVADAKRMLLELSGKTHSVVTGIALLRGGQELVRSDETAVSFRDLKEEEIRSYVARGEPMDKAGAYAIQGGAAEFVSETRGSISNVIGLPIELLRQVLSEMERVPSD